MKLEAIDFSKDVSIDEIYKHVRYYYTKSSIAMEIARDNPRDAMEIYKEIRYNLKNEYKEYSKVKNWKYIHNNNLYVQYKDNIVNAYVKPTNVTAYRSLNSNLYDVYDYMHIGFSDYLRGKGNVISINGLGDLLNEKCKIITKDFLVFEGKIVEVKDEKEYIAIHDFEQDYKISFSNIDTIDRMSSNI